MSNTYHAVADLGYSQLKLATTRAEFVVPHALVELSRAEWDTRTRLANGKPGPDLVTVNGRHYAIGQSALDAGILLRPKGAARYTRDYYGVLAAAMLARAYPDSSNDVNLFIAHPPADVGYRDDLLASVRGDWEVIIQGVRRQYRVARVGGYEEPLGGLMNRVLNERGDGYAYSGVPLDGYGFLLDIGGHTVNCLGASPGGNPDYLSLNISIALGIDDALEQFATMLRGRYSDFFKNVRTFRMDRLRFAMATGAYEGGGERLDCALEAEQATSRLMNQIAIAVIEKGGGAKRWDYFLLSGGGSGLLVERLRAEVLDNHREVYLADERESIHLANVRGGVKIYKALRLSERA